MIVRIATEGQYRLAEEQLPRLHELDAEVVAAAEIIAPAKVALAEAAKRKALRVTPTNAAQ